MVIGAGKLFCGGADVKAFNTPASRAEPSSRTIIKNIEASQKPVIAAIHGSALGPGGLEFAIGCHYRIAQRGARLGLPEVKLGLLPGRRRHATPARLAGVEAAVRMITEGEPAAADEALAMGLVDEMAEGELLPAALAFAERVAQRSDRSGGLASSGLRTRCRPAVFRRPSARRSRPRSVACPRRCECLDVRRSGCRPCRSTKA